MHIFISHASKDAEIANRICDFLEKRGKKCFLAPRDIHVGREYAEEIINGIEESEAMVLVMSEYANTSPHVLREVERAVSKSIPILVYKLTEVTLSKSMEYFLMTHQWFQAKPQEDFADIWNFICDREKQEKETKAAGKRCWALWLATFLVVAAALGLGMFFKGSRKEVFVCPYEVGDTITFGNYNGEEIEWQVLKLSEDGAEAVLVAENILTMKAFDAAEGGSYNSDGEKDYWSQESPADTDLALQIRVRGNSDWSTSNIRTWLNSDKQVVTYADQAPMTIAMAEKTNGYHNEAGFLHDFSEEELAAIIETENVTPGNALTEGTVITHDKVYLLSLEELKWFEEACVSMLAVPTQAAIEQDQSKWYAIDVDTYGVKEYTWWLREPLEGTSSKCYLVGNGYTEDNMRTENVGLEGYGIRPAVTVNLQADCFSISEESK